MALDRSRHDGLRPPLHGLGAIQRREHRGHVMSVDHLRIETLRLEFQPVAFHVVLVHRRLALAEPVDVSDHRQIIEVVMRGERGRFPDLPFRQFAVAGQHVDPRRALIHPRADREARAYRKSLAQRAGRGIHAMNPGRRVALQLAGELPQRHHPRNRKHARLRQRGVEHWRRVAFRKHETIVVIRVRILRIKLHRVKEYSGHQLGGGHARSRMSRACGSRRHHRIDAQAAWLFP